MQECHQVGILEKKLDFSSFIHAFAQFLLNYFELEQPPEIPEEERLLSESQVVQSLVLIEKLHMLLYLYFSSLRTHFSYQEISFPFMNDSNKEIFEKLEIFLELHPFLIEEHRIISRKTVAQILNYYIEVIEYESKKNDDERNNVTIILSPLPPPWLANHVQIFWKKEV